MAESSEPDSEVFGIFTKDENDKLPEAVKTKLRDAWDIKVKELLTLKVENDKIKINADQEKFNLERELVVVRGELEEERALREEASESREKNEERIIKIEDELSESRTKVISLTRELQQSQNEQESVSSQSAAMAGSLETRTRRIQELQEQVNSLDERLTQALHAKYDAVLKAEESASKELKAQYRERRLEQERSLLARQVEVLQQQINERAEENLNQRREHSSTILNLQATLNRHIEELRVIKEEKEMCQKQTDDKSKRIEELLTALNSSRESESKLDEMYRQELSAQKKLAEIYQGSADDEKERCGELEKALEEHRQLLQSASEQYALLERTKEKMEEDHAATQRQSSTLVKELKDELDKANVLLSATAKKDSSGLEEISPAASAATNLISKGLSLTQLYTEYMSVSEKLNAAEEENKRLHRYVDGIVEEIEQRVPIFKKQREEHQNALETINSLHSQLESCLSQTEKQKYDLEEAVRRRSYLERENERLNLQAKDLSKQVTVLVTQVEAARAGQPPPPVPRDLPSPSSAGDIISERMVAFRNVSELQEQNKMLRESLRKLSEDMETNESAAVTSRTKEMEEEIKNLRAQLSELRSLRERQESLMENISKQRDMYKSFCNERSPKTKTPPVKQPPPVFGVPQEDMQKMQKEMEEAKKKLEETNKEHEDYRVEVKKNEKMQQDEYNRLRTTMEKTMSENVKLLSQAEFNDERIKVLQHNSEVLQRQLAAMQNNNSTLHGIVGRHEATIEAQRREFMVLQKDNSRAQVTCDNMREEMKLLKEAEARFLAERESLTRSQSAQAIVLANLESIKNNLERTDSEKTMRLENQVAELTEKCSRLQAKLETNTDFKEAQSKLKIAEDQLKTLETEKRNLTKQVMDAKAEIMTLKTRLKETQERVRTPITSPTLRPRSPLTGASQGGPSTIRLGGPQMRDLQVQLNEEKAKVTSLQANLEESRKSVQELMNVTKQQEKQLKDSSDSYRVTQEQFQKMQKERDEMEATMTKLQSKLTAMASDSENVKSRLQSMLDEAKDELQASEKRLKDANESFQKAKEEEERARKEAQKINEQSSEVQNKYEREVMLHGTDLKTLAELKKRQAEFDNELQKVTAAKTKAEEAVRDTRLGFEKRENVLRRENKDLMLRAHELEEQNKALLDNFTQLSDKMAAIQTKLSSSNQPAAGDVMDTSISEDEARTSDQLREVIKYLRRERDVAAGKYEVAEAEAQRLIAQKKLLESQIQDIHKTLANEREKSKTSLDTASNYGELQRKVLTLDALADSNRLLREEKESLEMRYEEVKAKSDALEKQIEPMNERHKANQAKIDALELEKNSMENEKDLYKKRTQELVDKLNQAKPEDFIKLQQSCSEQQKSLQAKESELAKIKLQLQQVQKTLQMTTAQKNLFNNQLQTSREEARKHGEELRKVQSEKTRIQQQITEENKKHTLERTRLQQQLAQTQERVRTLEATAQQSEATHQQEMRKLQEQVSQEKNQMQESREQALESKGREEQVRHLMEVAKKEKEEILSQLEDAKQEVADVKAKADNLEKQTLQLRKIATKYKRQAESNISASPGAPDMGEEGSVAPAGDKMKELEETIQALKQEEKAIKDEHLRVQQENTTLKENLSAKENEGQNMKTQLLRKEAELSKFRAELESKKESTVAQIADLTKRLDEYQGKKQVSESRLLQVEKEREQYLKEIDMLNKKLQMQQRQIENLQKQATGTSKPSTSGVSSEKSSFEPPPTANIKPMNNPVAPSASPRSQTATQVVPPSRPIPTASIRPMAPPSGGSAQPQGSTVVVVSPLETHSDGMVSSTVTLPQATVTPTPAISAPTLLTTATTTPAATLTATVSPTPASASLTTPVAPAVILSTNTAAQSSPQSLTATQSTSVSQSSVSQSAAAMESASASQSSLKPSGLQSTAPASSSAAVQSTVSGKGAAAQQPSTGSTSVVTPLVSAAGVGQGSALTPSKSPGAATLSRPQEGQDVSADALISQAIALVTPLSSQESAGPSGVSIRKRKLTATPEASPDMKRQHIEDEGALSSEDAGPSSSHGGQDKGEGRRSGDSDVILVDSDDEEGQEDYPDQGDDGDDDDDDDEDDHMDDQDRRGIPVRVTDSDDDMDHEDSSREASEGFEAGQEMREAERDLDNAEAEAEAASEASAGTRREQAESQDGQSERPQPSAGPSQPSSSSQGNEATSRPMPLPRPVPRQDRFGATGRQTLTPFSQLPQYEEAGDDSIVPSTPTLYVPRRDGFSEAVSSPQVPSSGFIFGSNPDLANPSQRSGLAQMAEGGLIDDTRIDLGQLDEGNRSQPTTPLHRSPTGAEGGVSTSEGSVQQRETPEVVITRAEQSNDEASRGSVDQFNEADSVAVAVDDDDEEEEEEEEDVEEEEEDDDEEEDQGEEEGDMEEHGDDHSPGELDEGSSDDNSQPSQDVSNIPTSGRRITPITFSGSQHRGQRSMSRSVFGGRGTRGMIQRERGASPLLSGRARRSRPHGRRGGHS